MLSFATAPEGERVSMPALFIGGRHLLLSKAVCYMNILENIVQNKEQTVPCVEAIETHEELFPTTTIPFATSFLIYHYF